MIEAYWPLSRRAVLAAMIVLPGACVTKGVPRAPADWPLWRTRQNGADIYLFGGATPVRGPFASARIEAALAASDYLWTETLPKTRAPMDELIKRYGLASKGSLTALLTPRDKVGLDRAAQKVKIPVASLEPFRPWIAAASLQDAFYPAVGRTGSRANDVLIAQAEAAGKPIFAEFPARDDIFGSRP